MTLALSDMEMWYLQDDTSLYGIDWEYYQDGLSWQRWNRRVSFDMNNPSVPAFISEPDGINSANGYSLRFLRGKYAYGPMNDPYLIKNYIIDNTDPVLTPNHPIWQFTLVAVQNFSSADKCYRFGIDTSYPYTGAFTGTGDTGQFTSDASFYQAIRWLGTINNSDFNMSYFLGLSQYFPLQFRMQQSTSLGAIDNGYCMWNALADTTINIGGQAERIYHGMNNSKAYTMNWTYKPWQVTNWVATQNGLDNVSGRREHAFDIPAGKTIIGVMIVTRDSKAIKNENGGEDQTPQIVPVSQYNWKISQVNVRAQRLVI